MSNHQIANILMFIKSRSRASLADGGDGFISSQNLEFDVGLNTKTIQRELERLVATGELEHRQALPRKPHYYRVKS